MSNLDVENITKQMENLGNDRVEIDVENLTKQLENFGKSQDKMDDEKPSANWNFLPPEMKRLCIKEMDFKARTILKCSSETEKRLVEQLKYKFNRVKVLLCAFSQSCHLKVCVQKKISVDKKKKKTIEEKFSFEFTERCELQNWAQQESVQKVINFLKQVLSAEIDELELVVGNVKDDNACVQLIADVISNAPTMSVGKLWMDHPAELGIQILRHCKEKKLTYIDMGNCDRLQETFFVIPQVVDAEKLKFHDLKHSETRERKLAVTMGCLEMFRRRPEVGKMYDVFIFPEELMPRIIAQCRDFIVSHHPAIKSIRVTTSDPSKHIWIRVHSFCNRLQMAVVSSEEPDDVFTTKECFLAF